MSLLWSGLRKAVREDWGGGEAPRLSPGEVGESKWLIYKENAWERISP